MDFILKPVISCAGDENLLPYFESRCLSTLGSQQVVWKHPKLSMVHSVRLGACFTRFRVSQLQSNVKVLSSGRPVRPVGTFQPLLYIYVTSNDVSHYTSHGGRNAIGSWLGHLRARNVFDWLIIMVNSDPQYNTPKILQKSNVLDKIKSDFNVRTGDRQFLEVPAPNSAEEKLFNESWNQLTYLVRKSIISACMSIIVDYDVHLQMLTDSCSTFTWDYFEYLDRKEELAHMYLFLGGHEHALHEYREATELLSKCIQASTQQGSKRPQWLDRLTQLSSSDEVSHYVCDYSLDVTNTEIKQSSRLKNRNATLFELKNYLLSRQASILCICDRLNEFPALAYHTICSTLTEINILNIQTDQLFRAVWILCICLNTLTNIRLDSDRSMDDVNKSIIELLDTAFSCNNILENINFTRLSKLSFHRSSSSSSSSTHSPTSTPTITTQSVFIDANKDSNVTIWYMSHLVDKIFTHFRCHEYQLLRNISPLSPINNVTSSTENSSIIHKLSSIKINENDTFCSENYSVELWLIIFNYIKQIGQLIGLWCIKSNLPIHREKYSLLNKIINDSLINQQSTRDSIQQQQQQQYDLVDQLEIETDQTKADQIQLDHSILFAHNHLIPLFTSSIIYSQIFTAIGQTLIGFLKLIHCPKRAYEIVYDLADFLLYIQICFILAGTKRSILRIAAIHVYNKIQFWYQTINFTEILSIPTFNDSINPNYWWEEAVEFRNSLLSYHQYVILDPYQMSPLFRLKSIELEGVCNCGYQLIFIQLKSNSDRTFKASVHISGSEPSYIDWQTLLNPNEFLPYHVMDKTNQLSIPQLDSQMHLINLTTAPSISVVKSLAEPNIHSSVQISRQHSLCSTKKRSRLSFSINGKHDMFGNENTESSTPVSTKNPLFILNHEESFVMIKPGLNKLSFIANVPGFLIPEQIFINCLDEINTEFKEASTEQQSMEPSVNSRSEVNFVSDIDGDVFGSSWRDTAMMKALLPKPEISVLNNSDDKRYPVVFGTCQPIPVRLRLGKLGLPEDCKLSTSLYRIYSNNKNFVFNTKTEYTHINVKKTNSMKTYNNTNGNDGNETMFNHQTSTTIDGVYEIRNQYSANDYSLISNSLDNHHQDEYLHKKHQTLFSQFILEDGPVDFIRESNSLPQSLECKINHPIPTFPPGCCLQLSRPLYLSATSCNDQFALSMPSGHYCILPVDIIKPLGFNLNIFPLPKTYVIFSLNITCVDTDPDSTITPEAYFSQNLICKDPVTFELSNMRFYICASKLYLSRRLALSSSFSNGQHQLYNRQLKSRSHLSMEDNRQIAGDFTKNDVLETGSTDKLHDTINESIESLTGDLLDNRITKAYVTHLTPFSIPWRFKSLEYNNFMKLCKESHCQPIGRFECTMNRIGNVKKINQDIRVDCVIGQQI
ncbi:unnamed protein product [Schistosoma rodhaini]|nr:unnamed protein product [Schistosoma rodhaini]